MWCGRTRIFSSLRSTAARGCIRALADWRRLPPAILVAAVTNRRARRVHLPSFDISAGLSQDTPTATPSPTSNSIPSTCPTFVPIVGTKIKTKSSYTTSPVAMSSQIHNFSGGYVPDVNHAPTHSFLGGGVLPDLLRIASPVVMSQMYIASSVVMTSQTSYT